MHKSGFLLLLAMTSVCGCGGDKGKFSPEELKAIPLAQTENLPAVSGGFVLSIGEETITAEQVIEPLMEQMRPLAEGVNPADFRERAEPIINQIIVNKISDVLLYRQAKKDGGDQIDELIEKAVESEVMRFVIQFGGDSAQAEEELRRMGMNWKSFREYQKRMILSQSYLATQLGEQKPVTHSELLETYNAMKESYFTIRATIEFQLIDIEKEKLQSANPNQTKGEYGRQLAFELMQRLEEGQDFGELAGQYSHGYRCSFGGLWEPVQPASLAEPYDVLAEQAAKIEPGQIARPIESGGHIFIMKLVSKQPGSNEPFEKVQKQVEGKIRFDRRKAAIDAISNKLVEQAAIANKQAFVNYCLRKIYRIANNN